MDPLNPLYGKFILDFKRYFTAPVWGLKSWKPKQ